MLGLFLAVSSAEILNHPVLQGVINYQTSGYPNRDFNSLGMLTNAKHLQRPPSNA